MRLIDADELKAELSGISYPIQTDNQGRVMGYSHLDVLMAINVQPTAYDVDKVVELLDDYLFDKYCVEGDSKIPEIVKGGGQGE